MTHVYNESGRGKKECPLCKKFVHVKSARCVCGYVFKDTAEKLLKTLVKETPVKVDKSEAVVYDTGGKGRKSCGCGAYVSARVLVCPKCNKQFVKLDAVDKEIIAAEKKTKKEKDKEGGLVKSTRPSLDTGKKFVGKLIFAPVGKPPFEPEENLESWCSAVFFDGIQNSVTYSNQALWYWYQRFNNEQSSRDRIWEWSKREGFDKMQEVVQEPILSSDERETDTLFLPD